MLGRCANGVRLNQARTKCQMLVGGDTSPCLSSLLSLLLARRHEALEVGNQGSLNGWVQLLTGGCCVVGGAQLATMDLGLGAGLSA